MCQMAAAVVRQLQSRILGGIDFAIGLHDCTWSGLERVIMRRLAVVNDVGRRRPSNGSYEHTSFGSTR